MLIFTFPTGSVAFFQVDVSKNIFEEKSLNYIEIEPSGFALTAAQYADNSTLLRYRQLIENVKSSFYSSQI